MNIAMIAGNRVKDVAVFPDLETAHAFCNRGVFPAVTEVAECPYGYGMGDWYENGTFSKADGTAPAVQPSPLPPAQPEPSTEDDLMAMAVDHEYRLTLLELGVL